MRNHGISFRFRPPPARSAARLLLLGAASAALAFGQNPWVTTIQRIQNMITGEIATALSVIAVCVGGIMFAFGEGQHKRTIALLIIGVGMALGAAGVVQFLSP